MKDTFQKAMYSLALLLLVACSAVKDELNSSPVIQGKSNILDTIIAGQLYTDTIIVASDDYVTYTLSTDVQSASMEDNVVTWQSTYKDTGLYNFEVIVADSLGLSDTLKWDIYFLNDTPKIQGKSHVLDTIIAGQLYTDTITVTSDDHVTYTLSTDTQLASMEDNVVTWQSTYKDTGLYSFEIIVSDSLGLSDTLSWEIYFAPVTTPAYTKHCQYLLAQIIATQWQRDLFTSLSAQFYASSFISPLHFIPLKKAFLESQLKKIKDIKISSDSSYTKENYEWDTHIKSIWSSSSGRFGPLTNHHIYMEKDMIILQTYGDKGYMYDTLFITGNGAEATYAVRDVDIWSSPMHGIKGDIKEKMYSESFSLSPGTSHYLSNKSHIMVDLAYRESWPTTDTMYYFVDTVKSEYTISNTFAGNYISQISINSSEDISFHNYIVVDNPETEQKDTITTSIGNNTKAGDHTLVTFSYDSQNRVIDKKYYYNEVLKCQFNYGYDERGLLTTEVYTADTSAAADTTTIFYDNDYDIDIIRKSNMIDIHFIY